MTWRPVVPLSSVPPGSAVAAEVGGEALVVWRTRRGEPVVMDARCPHQWSHLAYEGVVDGDELVCTSHHWRFDARGGGTKVNVNGRRDPKADVRVHACRVRDGVVECLLPAALDEGPHDPGSSPMTDASPAVPDADREVGAREIAAGDARTVVVGLRLPAPADEVWAACTEPERLDPWFGPVTGELRIGGDFALGDGTTGEIVQCDPARVLTVTWIVGDGPIDEVQLRLRPDGGGTILEVEHAATDAGGDEGLAALGASWEANLTHGLAAALAGEAVAGADERRAAATRLQAAWLAVTGAAGAS